ncbi:MAG: glycosyltransferase family 4 protein [Burkholderiaceae bacterium]|nr:glycosyltransferase family 4 protein [Burkholderiaceae bacterium]
MQTYERHNDDIDGIGAASLAAQTIWSKRSVDDLSALAASFRPDVAHVHNTFPLISPSVYPTLKRAGVPIVQTLHNYRLACLNAMLLREGGPCEDCVGHLPWRGVLHRCYRDSASQSAVLAATLALHRTRTIYRHVDRFIVLTGFAREVFVRAGLPPEKIVVKPNFVPDRGAPPEGPREGVLYVGRLSEEKGIGVLAQAARLAPEVRIDVIGDGPCASMLKGIANVRMLGRRNAEEVRRAMTQALYLVVPSLCYEGFPMTIVEAYEAGLPVIASEIGSLAEIVRSGETGSCVPARNAEALSQRLLRTSLREAEAREMSASARAAYERNYCPSVLLGALEAIYRDARVH